MSLCSGRREHRNLHIKPGTETEELDKHNIAVVKSLDYFDVYRRRRVERVAIVTVGLKFSHDARKSQIVQRQHIFHFAHEFWDFPSWEAYVARSKIFAVEANPLIDVENYRHCNLLAESSGSILLCLVCSDPRIFKS